MHPFSTCWFGTNHMPHTRDFSDALFRRALVVEFNQVFKPENGNCDPNLKEKLLEELPGILNLALDAYTKALTHGFTMPDSCIRARSEWRLEADQVAQFVNEACEKHVNGKEPISMMFRAYKHWAEANGIHKAMSMKGFRDRLTRLGFGKGRNKSERTVTGLKLHTLCGFYRG
jgi:putative DNA primase/helicase